MNFNKSKIVLEKNTSHPRSLLALGYLIIAVNLGTLIQIAGFNLSWIIAIYSLCIYLIEEKKIYLRGKNQIYLFWFMLFWAFYALFQLIISKDLSSFISFYLVLIINIYIVIYMILVLRTKYEFLFALNALSIGFAINILAAGWEYFTGSIIIQEKYIGHSVVAGFIGNYNDFCTFMFLAIIVFLIQFYINKRTSLKLLYIVGILCACLIINYNGARGAIFACYILVALTIIFLIWIRFIKNPRTDNRLLILLCTVSIFVCILWINQIGINTALSYLDRSGGGDIGSDIWRWNAITICMNSLIDTLGFGLGPGQSTVLLGGINVHNFYIEIMCEYGIIIGLLAVYLSFIVFIKRNRNNPIFIEALLRATGFGLIIANVTSSSSNKMRAMWIFLILVYYIKNSDFLVVKNDNVRH